MAFFTLKILKMAPSRVRFSQGFLSGAGFPGYEFAPAWLENCEGASLRSNISAEAAPAEFGVQRGLLRQSSRTMLEKFAPRKTGFSHVVSCDEIACRKSCTWRNPGLNTHCWSPLLESSVGKQHLKLK
jgi:hypothetical protein